MVTDHAACWNCSVIAILRLVLMARFAWTYPAEIIEQQIATALDLIVMSQRDFMESDM